MISIVFLTGCKGKEKIKSLDVVEIPGEQETVIQEEMIPVQEFETVQDETETEEELVEPYVLYRQYDFAPVDNVILENVDIIIEDDIIKIFNEGNLIISLEDLDKNIVRVENLCKKYLKGRLYSSAFYIEYKKFILPAVISWEKGFIKIYNKTAKDHRWNADEIFYSGSGEYFVMTDVWCVQPSYYDNKKFKTIEAKYDNRVYVIDINTDETVYYIEGEDLNSCPLYYIDKITYNNPNFRITLGDYYDSADFTDFEIFVEEENFRYEIYVREDTGVMIYLRK